MRKPLNDFRLQQQVRHCLSTLINGLGPAAKLAKPHVYGLVRFIQVPFRSPPSRLAPKVVSLQKVMDELSALSDQLRTARLCRFHVFSG